MQDLSIAVCACTYKRPAGLRALLDGLAAQNLDAVQDAQERHLRVDVIIADNEGSDLVREICATARKGAASSITYVYALSRGIPFARNACLAHVPDACDFICFIDDDEVPDGDWLAQLLITQATTGADVIAGRVVPVFSNATPAWIANGGFFGAPRRSHDLDMPKLVDGQVLERAATNNVMVRASAVRTINLRFDETFALSGGSDTMFFRTLDKRGCRIVFAESAVVFDHIPISRANVRYMFRERFRIANINTMIDGKIGDAPRSAFALVADGSRHIGFGFRRLFKTALSSKRSKDRFAVGLFQMAHGLGIIAAALGFRYQHYK